MRFILAPIFFLWPGFNGVARYGLWRQLAIALLFGFHCQATLVLNFYWCDFLSSFLKNSLYVFLFLSWAFLSVCASSHLKKYEKMRKVDSNGEAFLEAQTFYLKGDWFETECCLKAMLKKNPFDPEALLMLATLYRHVKRYVEAKRAIADLEKLDSAFHWRYEIALEKKALKEEEKTSKETGPNDRTEDTEQVTETIMHEADEKQIGEGLNETSAAESQDVGLEIDLSEPAEPEESFFSGRDESDQDSESSLSLAFKKAA